MEPVLVYHNPVCSNSRGALETLADHGIEPEVVQYLKAPPDRAALERIVAAVSDPPGDLVRKDKRFGELGLSAGDYVTGPAVVSLLLEHPELMQRPVVFVGDRAVIARPPAKLLSLLGA